MLHAERHVDRPVRQPDLGLRGALGQLGLVDEVIGRGGRRLEEQALHGVDAAARPVRQEHQGLGRAEAVLAVAVLPHGAPAPVALAHRLHGLDDGAVLGVRASAPRSPCSCTYDQFVTSFGPEVDRAPRARARRTAGRPPAAPRPVPPRRRSPPPAPSAPAGVGGGTYGARTAGAALPTACRSPPCPDHRRRGHRPDALGGRPPSPVLGTTPRSAPSACCFARRQARAAKMQPTPNAHPAMQVDGDEPHGEEPDVVEAPLRVEHLGQRERRPQRRHREPEAAPQRHRHHDADAGHDEGPRVGLGEQLVQIAW